MSISRSNNLSPLWELSLWSFVKAEGNVKTVTMLRLWLGATKALTAFFHLSHLEQSPISFLSGAEVMAVLSGDFADTMTAVVSLQWPPWLLGQKEEDSSLSCFKEWRPFTKLFLKTQIVLLRVVILIFPAILCSERPLKPFTIMSAREIRGIRESVWCRIPNTQL